MFENTKIIKAKLILYLLFFPCCLFAQTSGNVVIKGNIEGLGDGEKAYLSIFDASKQAFLVVDSVINKDGKFLIDYPIEGGPRWCLLQFATGRFIRLALNNNENIEIKSKEGESDIVHQKEHGVLDDMVTISGSPTNDCYRSNYTLIIEPYHKNLRLLNISLQKLRDSVGFDSNLVEAIFRKKQVLNKKFAVDLNSYIKMKYMIPFILYLNNEFERSGHAIFLKDAIKKLSEKDRENYFSEYLFNQVASLSIGDVMPEFELPDTNHQKIALSNIIAVGKFTLVHFWANKSYNREEIDKNLFTMYKLFHSKGLNIIGVSSDKYVEEWKEALDMQKYPWRNVLDKNGKLTTELYKEGGKSVPNTTDVLLDNQGKIIAWDPSPIELQYYLWENLGKLTPNN